MVSLALAGVTEQTEAQPQTRKAHNADTNNDDNIFMSTSLNAAIARTITNYVHLIRFSNLVAVFLAAVFGIWHYI